MIVKMELNIPPHFFESADNENNFESVSEKIAKAFVIECLHEKNLKKGCPEKHEPDYISENQGYEVTLAIEETLVPQLKGVKMLETGELNIEDSLIKDIAKAIEKKSCKNYSSIPNLFIITLYPLLTWYYPLYIPVEDSDLSKLIWETKVKRRNDFFDKLYSMYIEGKKFKNIYILLPTHKESFVLFDIKCFGSYADKDFLTPVKTKNKKAFPTYKVTHITNVGSSISQEITVVRYIKE